MLIEKDQSNSRFQSSTVLLPLSEGVKNVKWYVSTTSSTQVAQNNKSSNENGTISGIIVTVSSV